MKRTLSVFIFLLSLLAVSAQTTTLKFTGRDANNHFIPLNRVVISNFTKGWQETIYYPDTILVMSSVGIEDYGKVEGFTLSQNMPNPFDGASDFSLCLPKDGQVSIEVYDLNGKKITSYNNALTAGCHVFRVLLSTAQSYFLTARSGNDQASIKMVNTGNAGSNALLYISEGNMQPLTVTFSGNTKGQTQHPFTIGDLMEYVGYAVVNGEEYESQRIQHQQGASQSFILNFDCVANPNVSLQSLTVTNVMASSATLSANVTSNTDGQPLQRGFQYDTDAAFANAINVTCGTGNGNFSTNITGLQDATLYYVRAFATYHTATTYSDAITFTTLCNPLNISVLGYSSICNGSSTTLTATGAETYQWSPATGLNVQTGSTVIASPTESTIYTVTGTAANGCTGTANVSVVVNQTYNISTTAEICPGESFNFFGQTLTAAGTYNHTLQSVQGCDSVITLTLSLKEVPNITISGNTTICQGTSTILTATGASTYLWTPATGLSSTTSDVVTANPSTSTSYSVAGTAANGCSGTASISVIVNPMYNIGTTAEICAGESYNFFGQVLTVAGTYTHTLQSVQGCDSVITLTLSLKEVPNVTISGNTTICHGTSTVLTATGAATYLWTPATGLSSETSDVVTANPSASASYSVTGTAANGCTGSASISVIVNPKYNIGTTAEICAGESYNFFGQTLTAAGTYIHTLQSVQGCDSVITLTLSLKEVPNITISGNTTICQGLSTVLTATGASTYLWAPATGLSSTTSDVVTANPSSSTSYSVTGTAANGCTATANVSVIVNPTYNYSTTAEICSGESYNFFGQTLTAAGTYIHTLQSVQGCDSVITLTLSLKEVPNVTISGNTTICQGTSTVLTATGAATYLWTPTTGLSSTTSDVVTANPSTSTSYSVTGTAANGCTATANVSVIVNPTYNYSTTAEICSGESFNFFGQTLTAAGTYNHTLQSVQGCDSVITLTLSLKEVPNITVSGNTTICQGTSTVLTATSASTYLWTPATGLISTTSDVVTANPSTSTSYSVTGTAANGCTGSASISVIVNPTYNISTTAEICPGESYNFYGQVLTVAGTYTHILQSVHGCDSVITLTLSFKEVPNVTISGNTAICKGTSTVLTATGAATYLWAPATGLSSTTSDVATANPSASTNYSVAGTAANGCTGSASISVIVNPTYNISTTAEICSGESYNFYGQVLTAAGTYNHTLQSEQGCDSVISLQLTVHSLPSVNLTGDNAICEGDTATISANGANTYQWSPATGLSGTSGNSVSAYPAESVIYTVNGTDTNGCVGSATHLLVVEELPTIIVLGDTTVYYGTSTTFTATGASTYQWSTGATGSTLTVLPQSSTNYVVIGTNTAGCSATQQVAVTVIPIAPSVNTLDVTNITETTALLSGELLSHGGDDNVSVGFQYSINSSFFEASTVTASVADYTANITGLAMSTTYYVRAYAINSVGVAYGNVDTFATSAAFTCGISTLTDVDGNTYNTVQIGSQCWMKENLRTTKYADGTSITLGSSTSTTTAYRYCPGNASQVSTYGYLYNWPAVMGNFSSSSANPSEVQGICPTGWHVPSDAEWTQLTDYVSSQSQFVCGSNNSFIAKALASTMGWNSSTNTCAVGNDSSTNNATGFSAIPVGQYESVYFAFGYLAVFWSATQDVGSIAYFRNLHCNSADMYGVGCYKYYGFSVRCLRNETISPTTTTPTVTTESVTGVTQNTATSGGNVISDGGASVTDRGVCWSTSQNPTISDSHTSDGTGTGIFTSNITGLTASTTYYVRAYATNSVGTAYGTQQSFTTNVPSLFTCGTSTITDYDGNSYNTVQIGQQCWMKENLRTTEYADGTSITLGSSTSTTTAYRYCPGNDTSNVATYGYLYNWPAVMHNSTSSICNPSRVQGICPDGWHVPSNAEWTQLENYVSSQSEYVCGGVNYYIAKALASTTGWNNNTGTCAVGNNPSPNNATGFSAVPAGYYGGSYGYFSGCAYFWSATQIGASDAYGRYLSYNYASVGSRFDSKYYGFSVRCLKDDERPTVFTSTVVNITQTSATCGGNVTSDGRATVTSRGICWSTNQNPTISDRHTSDGTGEGNFTSNMASLTATTTYYVRAYAINSAGVAYGDVYTFTTASFDGQPCPNSATLTDVDGNVYSTVQIGNQCWMKENLRTTKYADGTNISIGSITSTTTAYRYCPDNDTSNVSTYGYLYNWKAVMGNYFSSSSNPSGVQGICPNGWHVPSDAEWTQLTNYVKRKSEYLCGSNSDYIAKALASTMGWSSRSETCVVGNNPSTNNATGFSAVPAGSYFGSYGYIGSNASFWSATQSNPSQAYRRGLNYSNAYVTGADYHYDYGSYESNGLSVRCLRNEGLPTIATSSVSEITQTSAFCGGTVIYDGGAVVTARGVCWSTNQNPTISDSHTSDGTGTGSFTSNMAGLTANTTYYVRAYAINSVGIAYGVPIQLRTLDYQPPTVITIQVSNVTLTSATSGGCVTDDGSALVTDRGICYNTTGTPTINDSRISDGSGTGSFISNLRGLASGTTYYVRAYAIYSVGVAYGNAETFTTSFVSFEGQPCPNAATLTDVDGNVYNTVQIGLQCWMKENLRTTKYADGTSISLGSSTSTTTAYRYSPYNNSSKVSAYGYLYNWPAVMHNSSSSSSNPSGVQGICPNGWHVPSDAEWTQLTNYVSSQGQYVCGSDNSYIAKALASTTGWNSSTESCAVGNNPSTSNATGFSAVPAGSYYGSYGSFGYYANFWSATQNGSYAYYRNLNSGYAGVYSYKNYKSAGYSVRCLKNEDGSSYTTLPTVTTDSVTGVTQTTATSGGNVTSDGGACVTARGVCWSTIQNPTISDSHTTDGTCTGNFTSSMTGLMASTTYYVRAYAITNVGVAYGDAVTFTTVANVQPCPNAATVTDVDGNVYNTVQIGSQCWMKENLRTTKYADGTTINLGSSTSTTTAYRYFSGNDSSNVTTYGYLYNWKAVMHNSSTSYNIPSGVQGICPNGWHVPSDAEWTKLTNYVSSQSQYVCGSDGRYIAKALASTTGWSSYNGTCCVGNNPSANNSTGFASVPAGSYAGSYNSFGNTALFWSSSEFSIYHAYYRELSYTDDIVYRNGNSKNYGFSVRCLKDEGGVTSTLPTVTTSSVSEITQTSAFCGGNVTSDGGASVTERGVCWSTSQNPTISDSHTSDGTGTGCFTSNITGLTENTTYYVRAYATSSVGTAYGEQRNFTTSSFSCGTSAVIDVDGNVYNTVQIGTQCWMKENLRTTRYADGTSITLGSSTSTTTAYRYYPNNDTSNVSTYGYLYNWSAVMGNFSSSSANPSEVQGICPTGWHVPSDAEWIQLIDHMSNQSQYVCGSNSNYIAKALASTTGWITYSSSCAVGDNPSANNATGFSALPAGYYHHGSYYHFGYYVLFWSSTEYNSNFAYNWYLGYTDTYVVSGYEYKYFGFSVRCLKN